MYPNDKLGKDIYGIIVASGSIYNYERIHQGHNINGKTPQQAFVEGITNRIPKEEPAA